MNLAEYDLTEDEVMANVGESESMAPEEESGMNSAPPPPQRRASVPASRPKDNEKGSARKGGGSRGPVMTLGDLGKQHESDSDSDGQEYHTGSEKSGMVVQDPNEKPIRRDLEAISERVQKSGAQEGPMAEPPRPADPRSSLFVGSSRTLSGETRQQEPVPSETGLRASPPDPVVHTVHLWRNGFTVNEGPLRRLDDPLNLPFLESINRSECPRELEPQDRSTSVNVNLVKRIDEDWQVPPESKYAAFKGQGHTLAEEPHSQAAEEYHAHIAKGSVPQIGEVDGSPDVLTEGLAAVLGPVVRDFDARVEGALKSQSLLTGSIDRLTKELDTLLEDTPIPMVAQHAAKLSGVRKRVASLMSTLRVIQGRIINMDRMLNAREASASNPQPRASSLPSPSPPLENSVPQSASPPPEISVSPSTSSVPENLVPGSSEIENSAS